MCALDVMPRRFPPMRWPKSAGPPGITRYCSGGRKAVIDEPCGHKTTASIVTLSNFWVLYPCAIGMIDTNLGTIDDSAGIQVEAVAFAER